MRISDWSSDVCSSDLKHIARPQAPGREEDRAGTEDAVRLAMRGAGPPRAGRLSRTGAKSGARVGAPPRPRVRASRLPFPVAPALQRFQVLHKVVLLPRSKEPTYEPQSLMRKPYHDLSY